MHTIVVIGGGGHAKVIIGVLKKLRWSILGYTDVSDRGRLLGVEYLGTDDVLPSLWSKHPAQAVMGVGKMDASDTRLGMLRRFEALGMEFPVVVSPQAIVNEDTVFGAGTVVFDGAVIGTGALTGSCCILNTNCTLDHDCRLGDNVHLGPGATVSGGVNVGDHCMIGAGAAIMQGVTLSAGCLIGLGSAVLRDITAPGTYVGCPARRIK